MSLLPKPAFLHPAVRWVLAIIAAIILLQTLFFKFTGAEESIYIFTQVGAEPVGRIGSGIIELIAAWLILWPRLTALGSLLAWGVMSGAILSHLTILGIVVKNDGGSLFILACVVWMCSALLLVDQRRMLPLVGHRL
jgi:putative oxidoreductase